MRYLAIQYLNVPRLPVTCKLMLGDQNHLNVDSTSVLLWHTSFFNSKIINVVFDYEGFKCRLCIPYKTLIHWQKKEQKTKKTRKRKCHHNSLQGAPSFVYPNKPDVLMVPYSDILTRSAVTTASGRTYHLSVTDQTRASEALSNL